MQKYIDQCIMIASAGCAAPLTAAAYNSRAVTVLSYKHQMFMLPASFKRTEMRMLARVLHISFSTFSYTDLFALSEVGGVHLVSSAAAAAAARARLAASMFPLMHSLSQLLHNSFWSSDSALAMRGIQGFYAPSWWDSPPTVDTLMQSSGLQIKSEDRGITAFDVVVRRCQDDNISIPASLGPLHSPAQSYLEVPVPCKLQRSLYEAILRSWHPSDFHRDICMKLLRLLARSCDPAIDTFSGEPEPDPRFSGAASSSSCPDPSVSDSPPSDSFDDWAQDRFEFLMGIDWSQWFQQIACYGPHFCIAIFKNVLQWLDDAIAFPANSEMPVLVSWH